MKKTVIYFFILAIAASCGDKNTNPDEVKILPVYKVFKKDTIVSNKFVADIQALKNVEIHARINGLMEDVLANEGQMVKKDQVLFKISDVELQIELLKAKATLKSAQAELKMSAVELSQMQTLFDKKVVAKNELELAKAKYEASEAKVSFANAEKNAIEQQISFTTIKSPFDGVINRIPLKEGSLIQSGSLLTTISELKEVLAYFSIPESIYFQLIKENRLKNQDNIELILPNGVIYDQKGKIETAEGEIDKQTGSIQFKARFFNPNNLIKHGTSGKLLISENKPNAILVPKKSVFSIQDKHFVFLVNMENKVKMKSIEIGSVLDDFYLVSKGLKENDLIVKEGTQSLRDGDKIKPKK
ncbi:MAG: efflux RND transporter periplasmic adaptor subunit [Crocinitomicaceae bacterium]|nr:efflux RND transporter periplasmic adaptor subunit [Crocinitomicaceae bacterium]